MKKQQIYFTVLAITLFLFSGSAARAQFTLLHSFSGSDGANPYYGAPAISGSTLYGETDYGGSTGKGVVYSMNTDGTGYTILHTFTGTTSDGYGPLGSVVLNGSTLYGTTYYGGSANDGVIYSVNTDGSGYQTLYSFTASAGYKPYSTLLMNGSMLYGTTYYSSGGLGSIFSFNTTSFSYSNLYTFTGSPGSGFSPLGGGLVLNGSTLYGMTAHGGTSTVSSKDGVVFQINAIGSGYTNLVNFAGGSDGANPYGGLTLAGSTLYGMTRIGGSANDGTIFSVNLDGSGYTNLYSFSGGAASGANPNGSLTLVGTTLYGTTKSGGSSNDGVVFGINLNGNGYSNLHSFSGGADGANPDGDLTMANNTLSGWTSAGGSANDGTVFAIAIPEPSSYSLLGCGLAILLFLRRR